MHKLRTELQVHDLRWKVLPTGIVKGNATIFAACNKKVTIGRVGERADRSVKLPEVITDASLLDVEDSHGSRLEAAGENGQLRVRCNAKRLVDRAREFDNLIE